MGGDNRPRNEPSHSWSAEPASHLGGLCPPGLPLLVPLQPHPSWLSRDHFTPTQTLLGGRVPGRVGLRFHGHRGHREKGKKPKVHSAGGRWWKQLTAGGGWRVPAATVGTRRKAAPLPRKGSPERVAETAGMGGAETWNRSMEQGGLKAEGGLLPRMWGATANPSLHHPLTGGKVIRMRNRKLVTLLRYTVSKGHHSTVSKPKGRGREDWS